ncbi:MAG: DUF2971 domain-containing protein [Limisphaerales bacterium]
MPTPTPNLPPLFKYCDTRAVPILEHRSLKVPTSFNDPFELSPVVQCSDPHAFAVRYVRTVVLSNPRFYNAHRSIFPQCRDFGAFQAYARGNLPTMYAALKAALPQMNTELQDEFFDTLSNKNGILCFSADPVQHLMWSHYAESHAGFLIEFDSKHDFLTYALKVEYMPQKAVYDPTIGPNDAAIETVVRTKSLHWGYEQEYRVVIPLQLTTLDNSKTPPWHLFEIDPASVKSVTFGCKTTDALKNQISTVLTAPHWHHVAKYQISLSRDTFSLIRNPI